MFKANNLLELLGVTQVTEIQNGLESIAPSIAISLIESSKEENINYISTNNIQYIYKFYEYNIIVDYENDIFIDEKILIEDLTNEMVF